ncbi:MAG: hypothetical protein E7Z72_00045 [Methanocorpusculum parvum]|nr:hypothetical protein [Methanocorpusculum parvum]
MTSESILLSLTKEEAVILFEWLYRNRRKDEFFEDKAEQIVFWNIECLLEKALEPDISPEQIRLAKELLLQE